MALQSEFGERTINELMLMFRNGQINLEPGFQRNSVWTPRDRIRLMQSVLSTYPLPCIFLYKRDHRGRLIYDVIDGKQRLETILMFARQGRFKRHAFEVKLDGGEAVEWVDWKLICKRHHHLRHLFESYKIPTVEVSGDLSQIIDLFVRINSTGKPLTSGEKRHARFYNSPFLTEAQRLVSKHQNFLLNQRILSPAQLDRMKGTELVSELLMSIHHGGIINKKTSLDRAIGNQSINGNTLGRIARELTATLRTVRKLFPELRQLRFRNSADFYSLFLLVWEMRAAGLSLNDRKRARIAERLLRKLSNGVDELRDHLRRARAPKRQQQLYADYLLTVQGDTDSSANRHRRAEILRGLLTPIFEFKDDKRGFSSEQRRLLWNSDERRNCKTCRKQLSWDDFTIDHVVAWTKGGETSVKNAQLLCRSCNSSKGGR